MQCFICVTYMIILCHARPPQSRELSSQYEKRSLFRDVIESLRIRSQLPEDINQDDENNVAHNYESYGYENEPSHLPSDVDFIPRRNDRIEMPSLKYRFPKILSVNNTNSLPREEVILYIETTKEPKATTQKPKKQKRPKPTTNKIKNKDDEQTETTENIVPMTNNMAGQSHIGNRDSQMVLKPTVIVNVRGTVSNSENDIRLERKNENETKVDVPQNIFNIYQEIKLERTFTGLGSTKRDMPKMKQNIEVISKDDKGEEDMMMCETATWNPEKNVRQSRKHDNVFQILLNI